MQLEWNPTSAIEKTAFYLDMSELKGGFFKFR